jgi:mono/diheme cytochrome c family protein
MAIRSLPVLALAALAVASAQPPAIKKVAITPTPADSGAAMFVNYCASCHGRDGRGDGPAAAALKKAPRDLTQLTIRNQGKFPELAVYEMITGDQMVAAHGDREMPVWGDVLKSLNGKDDMMVKLRISNLTSYLKSLQR